MLRETIGIKETLDEGDKKSVLMLNVLVALLGAKENGGTTTAYKITAQAQKLCPDVFLPEVNECISRLQKQRLVVSDGKGGLSLKDGVRLNFAAEKPQ